MKVITVAVKSKKPEFGSGTLKLLTARAGFCIVPQL
jgi:hypothetical protein